MTLCPELLSHIEALEQEAHALLLRLAVIPAPSGKEEQRARFCKDYLEKAGAEGVYIDEALNVIYPIGCEGEGPISVFLAHTDLVFPDETPLPLKEEEGKIFCPGIGDNDANLAALLTVGAYVAKNGLLPKEGGVLLVANASEEGLGNLKGCKAVMARYGHRIKEMVSFDSMNEGFGVNRAVGSKRFRVLVKTEGGHSFNAFGKRNAIAHLANLICALEKVPLPAGGKTTYNFGEISGGTSVNTIAQSAEMLYEIRSDNGESLAFMHEFFEKTVAAHQASDAVITVTSVGERPCGRTVDPVLQSALEERARVGYRHFYGTEVSFVPGSTDCNIPLSCGVPSLCVGCCHGKGAHTREEYVEKRSLLPGLKLCFHMVLADF